MSRVSRSSNVSFLLGIFVCAVLSILLVRFLYSKGTLEDAIDELKSEHTAALQGLSAVDHDGKPTTHTALFSTSKSSSANTPTSATLSASSPWTSIFSSAVVGRFPTSAGLYRYMERWMVELQHEHMKAEESSSERGAHYHSPRPKSSPSGAPVQTFLRLQVSDPQENSTDRASSDIRFTDDDLPSKHMTGSHSNSAPTRSFPHDRSRRSRFLRAHEIRSRPRLHMRKKDSCWSQVEQPLFYRNLNDLQSSGQFVERIREYKEMHARCTSSISSWPEFFNNRSAGRSGSEDLSGCKYLLWVTPSYEGLGNRLISLVSSFVFAILTNRAFIMPHGNFVSRFFCNPFTKSDWRINDSQFEKLMNVMATRANISELKRGLWNKQYLNLMLDWTMKESAWGFYCKEQQREISKATFVVLKTDAYLVPIFYLIPSFKSELERLFPDRRVFTHTARYLLHPANYLWDKIVRIFRSYFQHHSLRIGIQVRAFGDDGEGVHVCQRILDCALNVANYLPNVVLLNDWEDLANHVDDKELRDPNGKSTIVFVTSLNGAHSDCLKDHFTDNKPKDGRIISVHSESHESREKGEDADHYAKALVEMWLLSFSDKLLVSDFSTFGYIASGLSGTQPFSLNIAIRSNPETNWWTNGRPVCALTKSEPCLLGLPPGKFICDGEERSPFNIDPIVNKCPAIQYGLGVELPTFES